MTTDAYGKSALGGTYKGFSTPTAAVPAAGPDLRKLLLGGVAAAVALGVGVGLWAKPALRPSEPVRMTTATTPQASASQVEIVFNPPPKPAPLKPGPRMEVLPADMAAAAPRAWPRPETRVMHVMEPEAQVRLAPARANDDESAALEAYDDFARPPPEPAYDSGYSEPRRYESPPVWW